MRVPRRSTTRLAGLLALAAGLVAGMPGTAAAAETGVGWQTVVFPHVDPATVPWAQGRLGFERVWTLTRGQGVLVAVVDSGIDVGNAQLAGAVQDGGDVSTGLPGSSDVVGHGTLVAGIIGARPASGVGFVGVAPAARLVSVRAVQDAQGTTNADLIGVGIERAVGLGASVVNVSIASTVLSPRLKTAVFGAEAAGVVVVAAAGNDATQGNSAEYPASLPGVLAVGSVDRTGARSGFSSTGTPISLVAPGSDIVSTGAAIDGLGVVGGTAVEGTSFAAPYVAGAAALVRAAYPALSGAQVIKRLEATADHPAGSLPDKQLGWGTVDPYAAVTAVLPGESAARIAVPSPGSVTAPSAATGDGNNAMRDAALVAFGAVGGSAVIAGAAAALPAARRRRWRAGQWAPYPSDSE